MTRWVAEFTVPPDDSGGLTGVKFEDSGQAAICYSPLQTPDVDPETWMTVVEGAPEFFVRLHSWDETTRHEFFRSLMGKKVRVTLEVVEG